MSRLRHLRLFVFLLLALFAGLTLCGPAFAFPDVPPDHPYAVAIDALAARGIISAGGFP